MFLRRATIPRKIPNLERLILFKFLITVSFTNGMACWFSKCRLYRRFAATFIFVRPRRVLPSRLWPRKDKHYKNYFPFPMSVFSLLHNTFSPCTPNTSGNLIKNANKFLDYKCCTFIIQTFQHTVFRSSRPSSGIHLWYFALSAFCHLKVRWLYHFVCRTFFLKTLDLGLLSVTSLDSLPAGNRFL